MLREFVASLRGIVASPAVAIAIAVLTLAGCGIKGPLKLPPSPGAVPAAAPSPEAAPASTPPETPAAAHEPAGRKP